jgi:hypothetical protein
MSTRRRRSLGDQGSIHYRRPSVGAHEFGATARSTHRAPNGLRCLLRRGRVGTSGRTSDARSSCSRLHSSLRFGRAPGSASHVRVSRRHSNRSVLSGGRPPSALCAHHPSHARPPSRSSQREPRGSVSVSASVSVSRRHSNRSLLSRMPGEGFVRGHHRPPQKDLPPAEPHERRRKHQRPHRRRAWRSGRNVLGGGPRAANGWNACCDAAAWAPPDVRPMLARRVVDYTPRCSRECRGRVFSKNPQSINRAGSSRGRGSGTRCRTRTGGRSSAPSCRGPRRCR